jgi:hypothetical protein
MTAAPPPPRAHLSPGALPPAKPLLYLDVDGVLNPVRPPPGAGFTAHSLLGTRVLLCERHGRWLRELSAVYELAWATTWQERANTFICPLLGLPELPVVPVQEQGGPLHDRCPEQRSPRDCCASRSDWFPILRHSAGRPFAWIDDVIPDRLLHACANRMDRLLLRVDPGDGLRRRDVDRLLHRPPGAGPAESGPAAEQR